MGSFSFRNFFFAYQQVDLVLRNINLDRVVILHECKQSAIKCFGCNVADHEAVRATAEATIGNQGNSFSEAGTNDERCWLEHLGHARCTFRAYVADYNYIAMLYAAFFQAIHKCELAIKHPGRTVEAFTFFTGDFCYSTFLARLPYSI